MPRPQKFIQCPKCNNYVSDDFQFCTECGFELPQAPGAVIKRAKSGILGSFKWQFVLMVVLTALLVFGVVQVALILTEPEAKPVIKSKPGR